jgi:uncharacterized membrane protein
MSDSAPLVPPPDEGEASYNRDRVIALSDGVFAIAITLLGFNLVPHVADAVSGRELVRQLLELGPVLGAYLLSFLVIGRFWDYHRTFFRYIYLVDARVVWTNMAILLWITVIPATAALLGSHWQEPAALVLYAVNLLLATASLGLLWRYVSSAGYLRREGAHAQTNRYVNRYVVVSMLGFALAGAAAFVSPPVSLALVFLTTTLARVLARRVLPSGLSSEHGSALSLRGADADSDDV